MPGTIVAVTNFVACSSVNIGNFCLSRPQKGGMTGTFVNEAIARALATPECNVAMGKIAAVSAAGSRGILPGTILSVLETGQCSEQQAAIAAALVELRGGESGSVSRPMPAPWALKNQLGLVCDSVAGLVEVPCIERNAAGVVIVFSTAEMVLVGIESKIPVDECVETMCRVGCALPGALQETAQSGLAAIPTGIRLKKEIFGDP